MNDFIARGIAKQNALPQGNTSPTSITDKTKPYFDKSVNPPVWKYWDETSQQWLASGSSSSNPIGTSVSITPSGNIPSTSTNTQVAVNDLYGQVNTLNTDISQKVNTTSLSTVATSGNYGDLIGKPTIPINLSDLTADSTHRLVNDTEITTWNNKGNGDMTKATYDTNNDGIVDSASTLNGLTSSITELNSLTGITGNVENRLSSLTGTINLKDTSKATYAVLTATTGMQKGDAYIVTVDETKSGNQTWYTYNGTVWVYLGTTNVTTRNFSISPISLTSEVSGVLPQANMNLTGIATTASISNKADKVSSATSGHFVGLDSTGNITDSGSKPSDFAIIKDTDTVSTTETYSINKILSLLGNKQSVIYLQNAQPSSPSNKDIWINNSATPYIMNIYNGTSFIQVGGNGGSGTTISAWTSGVSYSVGNLVIENNNIYQCLTANNDSTFIIGKWSLISSGIGTVTSVTSSTSDISIATTTSTPVLTLNSGTGANQIVKLNASGQLPAVNGVNIIGLTSSQVGLGNVTNNAQVKKITSSVNNDIVIFNGTTGDTIADSGKTLPSGNVVGTTDAQILTNKTLNDTTTIIENTADNTKQLKLDVSGVTTGNTRTLIVPDKNGTIATLSDIGIATMTNATSSATGAIQLAGDLNSGTATSPVVTGINGIHVNDATRSSSTPFLWWNSTSHNYEHAGINVGNIVNSSGNIVQPAGSPILISQNQEVSINHTAVTNDRMIMQILEQIPGATSSDMSTNFATASDYTQQDSTKTTIGSGTASFIDTPDSHTKLMLHMDGTNGSAIFTDSSQNGLTITPTSATISTANSKFNGASGYFNGTSGTKLTATNANSVLDFANGDYTIDFWIYATSVSTAYQGLVDYRVSGSTASKPFVYLNNASLICGNNNANLITYQTPISINTWYHIALVRASNVVSLYLNGVKSSTTASDTLTYVSVPSILIGSTFDNYAFHGYIDELRISNIARWTSNFTPSINEYHNYVITSSYIATKLTSFSLSNISEINSLMVSQATPTNTSIKWLVSFDGRKKWLYHDGTGWHIAVDTTASGSLSDSGAFTNSNVYTDIQTYFTNLTIAQLTTDLSGLSITPIQLDFAWKLATTDVTVTPSLNFINIGYTTMARNEFASSGKYTGTTNDFGIRRINATTTNIKKKSTGDNVYIIPNIIIGS